MSRREPLRSVPLTPHPDEGAGSIDELRGLLLEDERRRLTQLESRRVVAQDVADVLPEAILQREAKDDRVERALADTIESGLFRSARKDPQVLADAIHPALGPAIRSMIQSTLRQSLESLNVTLENSLSPRGLRWRIEAARTGRPFSEVVLLNTLVYRVEHVLLVHRETGLVASEAASLEGSARDGDLLAGMLSAIRDFASDSLGADNDDRLEEVEMGGLTMIVAQGPLASLALVVRGNPPRTLHARAAETVDRLHVDYGEELGGFEGDELALAAAEPILEDLLEGEAKRPAPNPWIRAVPVGAAMLLAGWLVYSGISQWRARGDLARVEAALDATPGVVVTGAKRRGRTLVVQGLVDPLAEDPLRVARSALRDYGRSIELTTRPYVSLDEPLVIARARLALGLGADVLLDLSGGTLVVEGLDPLDERRARVRDLGPLVGGVERVEFQP